jgi:two-component system cell cycle sensor histidine kinase/response regulator CckA
MVLDTILEHGNYVMVSIHDRGCGIPKEFIDKIFDPYFTTKPKGTGIGLASVYSIIKKHGGYIQVESEEKIGTNFVFYLPAAKTKNTEKGSKDNARKNSSPHILIMDDDIDIGKILIKILNKIGYAAELTKEGTEAIFRYQEALSGNHPFDIVIMDLTIRGGMGGREACGHILKIDPKAKIIVSSGYSNDPILARYEDYGFVDVLVKPFSIDNMIKAIKRLVD